MRKEIRGEEEVQELYVRCDSVSGVNEGRTYFIWFTDDKQEKYCYVHKDTSPYEQNTLYHISYEQLKEKIDKYGRKYIVLKGIKKLDTRKYVGFIGHTIPINVTNGRVATYKEAGDISATH